ncbi:MAG: hypothetical protein LWX11_02380 [Firmicutes bacterium]|nr:hypothetical protein [Bacillota bacterium]
MSRTKWMIGTCLAAAVALLGLACTSTTRDNAPQFNAQKGQHPAGWMTTHWEDYSKNPAQCTPCHGSSVDASQGAGTSGISCFKCHPSGAGHPAGWSVASQHGRLGAQAAPGMGKGFATCAKCHGADYKGSGQAVSCMSCHVSAPHPAKPWNGATASLPNHTQTNINNASECANCHAGGANSTMRPNPPAANGTAPGCFNNTLCHGTHI